MTPRSPARGPYSRRCSADASNASGFLTLDEVRSSVQVPVSERILVLTLPRSSTGSRLSRRHTPYLRHSTLQVPSRTRRPSVRNSTPRDLRSGIAAFDAQLAVHEQLRCCATHSVVFCCAYRYQKDSRLAIPIYSTKVHRWHKEAPAGLVSRARRAASHSLRKLP